MIAEPGIFLVYQFVIHRSVSKTHEPSLRSNILIYSTKTGRPPPILKTICEVRTKQRFHNADVVLSVRAILYRFSLYFAALNLHSACYLMHTDEKREFIDT